MNASLVSMPVLVGSIAAALIFDFLNGLHDSANAMATVVATRVLRPLTAVVWASFFNVNALCLIDLPHPPAKTDSP
jgi:PiT family inorganic phosphate transporter